MTAQVVIGKLKNPSAIQVSKRKTALPESWDHRAMWSYLRLQYGKSIADMKIKEHFKMLETMKDQPLTRNERHKEMKLLFRDLVAWQKEPRKIQFILSGSRVMAVASLKHLLIPPAEVYDMAKKILEKDYEVKAIGVKQLEGLTYEMEEVAGFKLGLQLYGGNITTRRAITVTSWLRVQLCLNPLSWLGVSGLGKFLGGRSKSFERILRIKVKSDLEPRLRQGIEFQLLAAEDLKERAYATKEVPVTDRQGKAIMTAMGISYSLGAKTIKQVVARFEKEPKSQWGLSMAGSWVAAHGSFKKTPKDQYRSVDQKLSTIAGAALLIDDIKAAESRSLEWLKSHVKEGTIKTIDELIAEYELI